MSGKSAAGEGRPERDSWGNVFWFLAVCGTIAMLSYEYLWSRLALRNLATTSFGGWFTATAAIAAPWILCFICVSQLREAVKRGKVSGDACMYISVWVEMVMLAAYVFFAPAVHRLSSLGALK